MGSIVVAQGRTQSPEEPVKRATVHDAEVLIQELHMLAGRPKAAPFTVYKDEVSKIQDIAIDQSQAGFHISDRRRLAHRILDLRPTTSQSVFRVNADSCDLFRTYLDS